MHDLTTKPQTFLEYPTSYQPYMCNEGGKAARVAN